MDYLTQHIESLIFATDQPISTKEIRSCLQEVLERSFKEKEILEIIEKLQTQYSQDQYAFEILEIGGGFQFLTKGNFHKTVGQYLKLTTKRKLSRSAMETLSIIAYKQPTIKSDIEKIRGVGCDYAIQKLLEKELIAIIGRSEGPGRPLLYGTSEKFMDYFGLKSLRDLPKPKDFKNPDEQIGEQAPIEE